MKKIAVLGSTGSIGTQALEVVDRLPQVQVLGLCANQNIRLLEEQIRKYRPKMAAVADEAAARRLKVAVADTQTAVCGGMEGVCAVAAMAELDLVVASIVGIAGLLPTMAAIGQGTDVALANKEALVTAGSIVKEAAARRGVRLLPVDSEHSAVFQCIGSHRPEQVERVILTASGGAFYGKTISDLKRVTVQQALRHPNWSMGAKITVDSGTLMNKGLEVIEAHWLFGVDYDHIDVVIHRESIVHSMVEFKDGSVLGQMGWPDMKLPIHYALCWPERVPSAVRPLKLWEAGTLTFDRPDTETFRCLPLAVAAGRAGGTLPTVLNGANEAAVALFLQGKIGLHQIAEIVERAMSAHKNILNPTLSDIIDTDKAVREEVWNTWC